MRASFTQGADPTTVIIAPSQGEGRRHQRDRRRARRRFLVWPCSGGLLLCRWRVCRKCHRPAVEAWGEEVQLNVEGVGTRERCSREVCGVTQTPLRRILRSDTDVFLRPLRGVTLRASDLSFFQGLFFFAARHPAGIDMFSIRWCPGTGHVIFDALASRSSGPALHCRVLAFVS